MSRCARRDAPGFDSSSARCCSPGERQLTSDAGTRVLLLRCSSVKTGANRSRRQPRDSSEPGCRRVGSQGPLRPNPTWRTGQQPEDRMVRRFADEVLERGLERDIKERTHGGTPGLEIPLKHRSGFLRWHFFNPKPLRASRAESARPRRLPSRSEPTQPHRRALQANDLRFQSARHGVS